eukprot:9631906-Lingulodinium_polyedra.AAC.1
MQHGVWLVVPIWQHAARWGMGRRNIPVCPRAGVWCQRDDLPGSSRRSFGRGMMEGTGDGSDAPCSVPAAL